jgi:cation:H+ antiporter
MVLGASSLINPLTIDLAATKFDLLIMLSASIILVFILANKLYNKAGAIFLLMLLALFIQNSI